MNEEQKYYEEFCDKEVWIILYLQDTSGWIGSFPSDIWQWVLMEHTTGPPKTFKSKKDTVDYIVHECLTHAVPFQIGACGQELTEKLHYKHLI